MTVSHTNINLKKRHITLFLILCFIVSPYGKCLASENARLKQSDAPEIYYKQVSTILKFYDVIINKEAPSIQDFFQLFSEDNEAELELGLSEDYPSFKIEEKEAIKRLGDDRQGESYRGVIEKIWQDNPNAKKYADEIYLHPDRYPSRVLHCFKEIEPALFSKKTKRILEFPPEHIGDPLEHSDFIRYVVQTAKRKVIFEFSPDTVTIETVYLQNGVDIFSLIPKCIKRR